jgi:CMP-N-acetylneuraminic acid synthetase
LIDGHHIVAVVPARGGSKSVPCKNLHPLGGRPLLAWPIESARSVPQIDRTIVSTDDPRIASAGIELGAEIHHRPAELATDTALVIDTLRHLHGALVAEGKPADIMVLLEATSPLRSAELILRCLRRLVTENLDSIATFHEAEINPERVWRIEDGRPRPFIDGAIPWKPRQQLTPAYQLNGAVYAFRPDRLPADGISILFGRMGAELVPANEVIDIDDHKDFVIANALLESRNST